MNICLWNKNNKTKSMKHNPKDRWKIPKVLTGEQCSLHLNKIITPCHLNPFFIHGHGTPGLDQLSLPPRNAPEGLKSSTGPDGLSSPPIMYAAKKLSAVS